jgi:uncharacterized protein
MSDAWDKRKKASEEEYFRRKEQEAIEKMHARRAAGEANAQVVFECPKCDGTLEEISYEDVLIHRCDTCGGVWLDSGELERLTEREESGGFFDRLKRSFGSE